jgi:8-oxo-dGTP pyrophosphatase MutT (NUDIX family)
VPPGDTSALMAREPIPTWCFAVCIVRLGRRVLLVQEQKHGHLWYLPAGRVEPGETFAEGARRETLEEAGVPVVLEGIVRIEHTPHPTGSARTRVMFVGRPADDTPPKTIADEHSLRAGWFDLDDETVAIHSPRRR